MRRRVVPRDSTVLANLLRPGHATTAGRWRLCYVKADATDLPPPARALIAPERAEAVTALYQAHALGLIRLAVVMLGRPGRRGGRGAGGVLRALPTMAWPVRPRQGAELPAVKCHQR